MYKLPMLAFCLSATLAAGTLLTSQLRLCTAHTPGRDRTGLVSGVLAALAAVLAVGFVMMRFKSPSKVFYLFNHASSPLASSLILVVLIAVAALFLINESLRSRAVLAAAVAVMALAAAASLDFGRIYTLITRPGLKSVLTNLLFFSTALMLGHSLVMTLASLFKEGPGRLGRKLDIIAPALYLVIFAAFSVRLFMVSDPVLTPVRLLSGDLALYFWAAFAAGGLLSLAFSAAKFYPLALICQLAGAGSLFYLINMTQMVTKTISGGLVP